MTDTPLFDDIVLTSLERSPSGGLRPTLVFAASGTTASSSQQTAAVLEFTWADADDDSILSSAADAFTFTLTQDDGVRCFGFCRRLAQPAKPPVCLCVLSRRPWFSLCARVLDFLKPHVDAHATLVPELMAAARAAALPPPGGLIQLPTAVGVLRRYGYQVYYGDATELELLRAAGAEKAKSIVITCNEPEDTMEIVRLCQQHFPNLSILARARGRVEAHELLQAGVKQFSRETFSGALELGRKALMELGMHPHQAFRAQQHFRRLDMRMLRELMPPHQGDVAQISRVKEARRELEELFHREMQKESRQFDGWDEYE